MQTGTTYDPTISATTTYYVTNETTSTISPLGLATTGTGGYFTANASHRLYFNVVNPVQINSVDVYAATAGVREIVVVNNAGTAIDSASFTAVVGVNTVPLGFVLPADTMYAMKMGDASTVDVYRNSAGAAYPYTVSNLVSLTGSDAGVSPDVYYYFFYNWKAQTPVCASVRVPVTGTVTSPTGIATLSEAAGLKCFPNPSNGMFTIEGLNNENTVEVFDVIGKLVFQTTTQNPTCIIDVRENGKGMYQVRVTDKTTKTVSVGRVVVE